MRHPTNTYRTVEFGWVKDYPLNQDIWRPGFKPGYGFHMGTDYAYSEDDPYVYAPEDGTAHCVKDNGSLGNCIYISAGGNYWALGHNEKFLVNDGPVKEGQRIAVMGDTGAAYGKHCHAALKINGELVDCYSLIGDQMDYEALNQTNIRVDNTEIEIGKLYGLLNETNVRLDTLIGVNQELTKKLELAQAQIGEASKWQTLKVLFKELLGK